MGSEELVDNLFRIVQTNAKLKNSGTCKFLRVFLELMKENKIFMENLVLICNEFCNE